MNRDEFLERIALVRSTMNKYVLERQAETDGILLAIVSGLSLLFLGDVGTAKTLQIRLASKLFGLSMFDTLLSETTKPEHIFGPTDIPALAKGKQYTKTKGYAPESELLFFDEIFKANAIVLNPLLWLMNEKQYRNGDMGVIQCPTVATFAASNEIPTDSVLKAIYDRLILRYEVQYLRDSDNIKRMVDTALAAQDVVKPIFNRKELEGIRDARVRVKVPDEVKSVVLKIRDNIKEACGFSVSDRRLVSAFKVIQAHALLSGRMTAHIADTEVVSAIFWDKPEHRLKVQAITLAHAASDVGDLFSYIEIADSVWDNAVSTGNMAQAKTKLLAIYKEVRKFNTRSGIQVREHVKEKLDKVKGTLENRSVFRLVKLHTDIGTWYKLNASTAISWTTQQLRSVGMRTRRKAGGYWYFKGNINALKRAVHKKLNSTVKVKSLIPKVNSNDTE